MHMRSSGLFERERESAEIAAAVGAASQGHGGLLLIEGPAGIGKTRLLAQARTAAAESGLDVVRARASELERGFAFGVVRQLFEPLLARTNPTGQEVLWEGPAAQAREIFTATTAGPTGDFAVLHGLYWLTANACQHYPLLLLIDDLQWCDPPSLRYLAYLLPRLGELPILVVAALRSGESATDPRLLEQITSNPAVNVQQPHPLTAQATQQLLRHTLLAAVDEQFAAVCHQVTSGNPLLLWELARTLTIEDIRSNSDHVALVRDMGSRAVAHLVALRMTRLPQSTIALAQAAAILGDHADLATAAALNDQDTATALEGITALERLQILHAEGDYAFGLQLAFIHPLVQTAVHDSIALPERMQSHRRAASILSAASAPLERIAYHLLQVVPAGDQHVVEILRNAASDAAAHGAPESALIYLKRCLHEPIEQESKLDLLIQLGSLATLVDMKAAAEYLQQARQLAPDIISKAHISYRLGAVLDYSHRPNEAISVLAEAESELPDSELDLRCRILSYLLNVLIVEPSKQSLVEKFSMPPQQVKQGETIGERLLSCSLAFHDMKRCKPEAIRQAQRALDGNTLAAQAPGEAPIVSGWVVLLAADEDTVLEMLNAAIAHGRAHGATRDLAPAYAFRALAWLWRGYLAEAEADAREACQAIDTASVDLGRAWTAPYLASAMAEAGRLNEAVSAVEWANVPDPLPDQGTYWLILESKARNARLQRRFNEALQASLLCGDYAKNAMVLNPALTGWRTEAALSLHALDRTAEARAFATEELELARRWGAPRALGRALRLNGLLAREHQDLTLFQEAVHILEHSPARLEYAKALADLGAGLRRTGHRTEARPHLRQALDLASQCGATPLADRVRAELAAAGGRPRRTELTGPESLTPSERRIAELAATGATNRQIAQTLFVTPKTVEVHLSAVYRKLAITTRTQLPTVLTIQ
ncbi:helix-turn-helix transcriptional regulator [Streptomyces sp. NPDC001139]